MHFILGPGHEESTGSFGLTLTVGGSVISGTVIPVMTWHRLWTEDIREQGARLIADGLEQVQATIVARAKFVDDQRELEERPRIARRFIHMRDVSIWTGTQRFDVPLWRGPMNAVTGWSMGSFSGED